jgi:HJR/Mrr/RecB family endonuclease
LARRRTRRRKSKVGGIEILLLAGFLGYYLIVKIKIALMNLLNNINEFLRNLTISDWIFTFLIILVMIVILFILSSFKKQKEEEKQKNRTLKENQERKRRILLEAEVQKLKTMHYTQFEKYVADLFSLRGFETTITPLTGDGGKDVILKKGNDIFIVECKRYNTPKVTRPDVQKFHSAIMDMNAKEGYYVTTGYFTKPAMDYVLNKPIRLVDLPRLMEMVEDTREIPL